MKEADYIKVTNLSCLRYANTILNDFMLESSEIVDSDEFLRIKIKLSDWIRIHSEEIEGENVD